MNERVKAAVERLKEREGRAIAARLAYEIEELDALVSLRLTTWADVARAVEINPNSLYRARAVARRLRAEWIKKGLITTTGEAVKRVETVAEKQVETAGEKPVEKSVEEVQENENQNSLLNRLNSRLNK